MLVSDLIKVFREEEKDTIVPYFTSDLLLITYLNEALIEFAKQTMSIYDISSDITRIYVPAKHSILPFDKRILEVKGAFIKELNQVLSIISANASHPHGAGLLLNQEAGLMSLTQSYEQPVTLKLRVIRKPLRWLTLNDLEAEIPDINDEDYRVILHYLKYLALSVQDAEIYDRSRASDNLVLFEQKCQTLKEQALRRRAAYQPIGIEPLWSV